MCGIGGFCDLTRDNRQWKWEKTGERMCRTLERRGPDDGGTWVGAVSYTHLAGANNALKAMAKALATGVEKELMRTALTKGTIYPIVKSVAKWFGKKTVSYTHLDVYKRQMPTKVNRAEMHWRTDCSMAWSTLSASLVNRLISSPCVCRSK